jgi:hypothetical protein
LPATSATPFSVTDAVALANTAMLDRPLPLLSVPVALAAVNVMFSNVTAAVTPFSTSGIVPAAGATFTIDGAEGV